MSSTARVREALQERDRQLSEAESTHRKLKNSINREFAQKLSDELTLKEVPVDQISTAAGFKQRTYIYHFIRKYLG